MAGILVNKLYEFKGHRDSVYGLAAGPTDTEFFSAGGDGMVAGWNLNHPDQGNLIMRVPGSVYAVCYLKKRHWLAIGQNNEGVRLVDLNTKKLVASIRMEGVAIFDMLETSSHLVVAGGNGTVYFIHPETGKIELQVACSEKSARCLAYIRESEKLIVGFSDNSLKVLQSGTVVHEWPAHTKSIFGLAYHEPLQAVFSVSRDARIKAWSLTDFRMQHEVVAHTFAINSLSLSPDGRHFITGSMDKTVKVWQADSLKLLKVLDKTRHGGHSNSVNKVLWLSPNRLVSASDDRNIYIWDIRFDF